MKFAILLKDNLPGWRGHAALYRFEPPLKSDCTAVRRNLCGCNAEYVIISAVPDKLSAPGTPEVKAFSGHEDATARCMMTLGVVDDCVSHETLIAELGYTLTVRS